MRRFLRWTSLVIGIFYALVLAFHILWHVPLLFGQPVMDFHGVPDMLKTQARLLIISAIFLGYAFYAFRDARRKQRALDSLTPS